jgi:hypothetical protein
MMDVMMLKQMLQATRERLRDLRIARLKLKDTPVTYELIDQYRALQEEYIIVIEEFKWLHAALRYSLKDRIGYSGNGIEYYRNGH